MKIVLVPLVAVVAASVFAADTYVSHLTDGDGNPYYAGAPEGALVYSNLVDGYNNASAGGTVWVEDGFVCDSGSFAGHGNNRLVILKQVTIRSRSGNWETGAEIRGAFTSESDKSTRGAGQIRCVGINQSGAVTMIGFRLVHCGAGSASGDARYGACIKTMGGTISNYGEQKFENCLVEDVYGGAVWTDGGVKISFTDCTFTNNVSLGSTVSCIEGDASVYNCQFLNNSGSTACSLSAGSTVSNCQFVANTYSAAHHAALICSASAGIDVIDTDFLCNTGTHNLNSYGGFSGNGRFRNCTFAGNTATGPGAAGGTMTMIDCVVSNNTTTASKSVGGVSGCWASNCVFVANVSSGEAGGVRDSTLFNCKVRQNKGGGNGGGAWNCNLTDCFVISNYCSGGSTTAIYGGGAYNCTLTNSTVIGNTIMTGYGAGGGLAESRAYNCTIVGNKARRYGGGVSGGIYTKCRFYENFCGHVESAEVTANNNYGFGGAVYTAHLYDCVVSNNVATYRGGAIWDTSAAYTNMNCVIVENRLTATNDYGSVNYVGGSGVWGGSYYNCLIARNTSKVAYGYPAVALFLYNSTVTDNTSKGSYTQPSGINIRAVNSIVAGNVRTGSSQSDTFTYATNSYVMVTIPVESGTGNVTGNDPKLDSDYVPLAKSLCRDKALKFDWMTDKKDIRSKDLAGFNRILGPAPDMGCFEYIPRGTRILYR